VTGEHGLGDSQGLRGRGFTLGDVGLEGGVLDVSIPKSGGKGD